MVETTDPAVVTRDAALVDVGAREVIHGSGADRIGFLHRLLTSNVEPLPVGAGTRALLLTTKGHIVADMHVCILPEETRLIVTAGQGAPTAEALSRYAIMDDFTATV